MKTFLIILVVVVLGGGAFWFLSTPVQTKPAPITPVAETYIPCTNYFNNLQPITAGYGAAYNLFSNDKELLVRGNCASATPQLQAGNGGTGEIVYNKAYVFKNNSWQSITLTSTSKMQSGGWYAARASAALPLSASDMESYHYVVAYVCQWVGEKWLCGCADTRCSVNNWQLQAIKN